MRYPLDVIAVSEGFFGVILECIGAQHGGGTVKPMKWWFFFHFKDSFLKGKVQIDL